MAQHAAEASALDSGWLDAMVTKLVSVLENQLNAVGAVQGEASDARTRAADARTLASLERTLEKLSKLERERAAIREKKIVKHGARKALEQRLDKRLAALEKREISRRPE